MNAKERDELFETLRARFEENLDRHEGLDWTEVQERLEGAGAATLKSLHAMEATGGEPDVVGRDEESGELLFVDCAPESPAGRRNLCYDREALEARKKHKPDGDAVSRAAEMGVEMLTEEQYRRLQELGAFDTKTSSWVKTPAAIRERGGALFCDRRYDHVFTYHNGAESYFAARGFRGCLRV